MATEAQFLAGKTTPSTPIGNARLTSTILVPFVISANGTLSAQIDLGQGAWITSVRLETPTAISGTPTTCNFRLGTAAAGQQIVADVDAKGQGHITATIVTGFDVVTNAAPSIFAQLVTSGGTGPAGTINALITVHPVP